MLKLNRLRVNYQVPGKEARTRVISDKSIVLMWAAVGDVKGAAQAKYRVQLGCAGMPVYDSGWQDSTAQQHRLPELDLPCGKRIDWDVSIIDSNGIQSEAACEHFYIGNAAWRADWIALPLPDDAHADDEVQSRAQYFRRDLRITKPVKSAQLYACGIGYQHIYINGENVTAAALDPAHTNYARQCQYVLIPDAARWLHAGLNCVGAAVGEGWRANTQAFKNHPASQGVTFFGPVQFSAMLHIAYLDGSDEWLFTDESWQAGRGAIVANNLFNGITYDAREVRPSWNLPGYSGFSKAIAVPAPGGEMLPMVIPPVYAHSIYKAQSCYQAKPGLWVYDFGQNIAGVVRVKLPRMNAGERISIQHMEQLNEEGMLLMGMLRTAKQCDTYIASGDERDLHTWQPEFTYHGFRYIQISGAYVEPSDIEAVPLYTSMDSASMFSCGSALVNQIQRNVVQTERANMHSILTDCPQRDERMGWMNDATVRFEETPYNFNADPIFRKLVRDLIDEQSADGAITCTAPFVFGSRPADPVCSSFLVAAWESWLHYGDADIIRDNFTRFAAWEDCLLANSTEYIVNYSYYGDWAGPAYACEGDDGARSIVTPGEFMSTGYSYFNCVLLQRFARVLGDSALAEKYESLQSSISAAMLARWYDGGSATMATGSMACQAFALWLGIIPEPERQSAADKLNHDLKAANYRFTTGNLATRYMFDMLAEYGHIDTAWELITREDYPSYGFMIQNEATTVWERFEMKPTTGMNSHNHPMYGAVGYWFYAYIAGIRPTAPGYSSMVIKPYIPHKLVSAQALVETVHGDVFVRWMRRYGRIHLYIDIPFGASADVSFMGKTHAVGSGYYHFDEADA